MKKFCLLILLITIPAFATGCKNDTPPEPSGTLAAETSETAEISLAMETDIIVTASLSSELIISAPEEWFGPFQEIALLGEKRYPDVKLTFRFADSGILYEELQKGAAVDLFISESDIRTQELQKQELAGDIYLPLGTNELILIANDDVKEKTFESFLDVEITGILTYGTDGDPMSETVFSIIENIKKEQANTGDSNPAPDAGQPEGSENDESATSVTGIRKFTNGFATGETVPSIETDDSVNQAVAPPETSPAPAIHTPLVIEQNAAEMSEDTTPETSSIEEKHINLGTAAEVILYVKEHAGSIGFVYRTDLKEEDDFPEAKIVPENWYEPKNYSLMLIETEGQQESSKHFLELMGSEEVRKIIQKYGITIGDLTENAE